MNIRRRLSLFLSTGMICLSGFAGAEADKLQHDPFVRPVLVAQPTSAAPASAPAATPELRAIMAAGPESIVNIEGVLLRRGEEFNGYRLVEVHEETAVFVKNSKRVTLSLQGIEPAPIAPVRQKDSRVAKPGDDSRKLGNK
jgi:hypothetical protein